MLVASCMSIPTVSTGPSVKPTYVEPITPKVFERVDIDNDGKLSPAETKLLPGEPVSGDNFNYIWSFLAVITSVTAVCLISRMSSKRKSTNNSI